MKRGCFYLLCLFMLLITCLKTCTQKLILEKQVSNELKYSSVYFYSFFSSISLFLGANLCCDWAALNKSIRKAIKNNKKAKKVLEVVLQGAKTSNNAMEP